MSNILLVGAGGQGIVLASKVLAQYALDQGEHVRTAETLGMAQRGGSVASHVRIGAFHSPMIPKRSADVLVGFDEIEASRALPYLKDGGTLVGNAFSLEETSEKLIRFGVDNREIGKWLRERRIRVLGVRCGEVCKRCGSFKVLNVALLGGMAAAGVLGLDMKGMERAVIQSVPEEFREVNLCALKYAADEVEEWK